jgi:eukaryotic-like serine/threonine-protein kinase
MAGSQAGLCARCLLSAALSHSAAAPTAVLPQPGEWIGSYRVLRLLGEGGMGLVYLASQEDPIARQVAIKIIKLGMDTRAVLARFQSEQQALALMEHPNIAQVYEAGSSAYGRPYFVMEYVPGAPITEYCDRHRLGIRPRLQLFLQVASAVQHAHQKGVIHRDLKPSNILVMQRDAESVPKIIDFGLAKATEKTFTQETLFTETGLLIGTPEYMSPEQALAAGLDVDTRTDIYSLGVLLYELLVGTVPFDSKYLRREGYEEIRRIIREDDPPMPAARLVSLGPQTADIASCRATDAGGLRKQVRGDLDWITMTAMAKDRDRRYASASEFAADIARHLRDEPVMASPPSTSYRLGKFIRKNRGAVLALAAVFASLVLGLGASTILYFRAERQRLEAQAQRAEAETERAVAEEQRAEAHRQGTRAERMRILAEQDRITADQQRGEAELQHAEAERQRILAEQQAAEARRRGAEALAERSAAEKQREVAEQQGRLAAQQSQSADEQRVAAERQRLLALRQSYAANLIAADLHIRSNEIAEARRRLFLCPPALRGWEWGYLLWKSDTSMATLTGRASAPASKAALGFSQDGARIFRTSAEGMDWWSLATDKPLAGYGNLGPVLAVDRYGTRIVSASARAGDYSLRVADPATGKAPASFSGRHSEATCAAFSPNGSRVVLGAQDGGLEIWDSSSGQAIARLDGHKGGVSAVAVSSDGARIVSGGEDRMVRIWDAATGHAMYGIAGHGGAVLAVGFSADRRLIVSGSTDKTARIWDAATGRPLHTLTGHECGVQGIAISPDGATVASASCATLRLWDTESGRLAATLPAAWHADLAAISFSPDGAYIAAAGTAGEIKLWNALTYGGGILRRGGNDVDRAAVSPDGARLALHKVKAQSLEVWDTRQRKTVWAVQASTSQITALAFSPDSGRLAAGWIDGTARLWNAASGQPLGSPGNGVSGAVPPVAYSPDGQRIAGGEETGDIVVRESGTGRLLATLKGHAGPVDAVAFSPDGTRIVSGSRDKTIRVWDSATYDPLLVMGDHDEAIASLVFSPDGARLYSTSADGSVRVWETRASKDAKPAKEPGL